MGSLHGVSYFPNGATDGEKLLCLDALIYDIRKQQCLIYSFGLSDDWTFEESVASLGCTASSVALQ